MSKKKKKASKNQKIINKEEKIMNTENNEVTNVTPIETPVVEGQMSFDLNENPTVESGLEPTTPEVVTDPTMDPVNTEVNTPEEPIVPESSESVNTEDEKVDENTIKFSTGKLDGCAQLYVRKEASKESDVVTVIDANAEILINEAASTEDFYSVEVNGFAGFCVKKFIKID